MNLKFLSFIFICGFFGIGLIVPLDLGSPVHESLSFYQETSISLESLSNREWQNSVERFWQTRASFRSYLIRRFSEGLYNYFSSTLNHTVIVGEQGSLHRVGYLQTLYAPPFSKAEADNWSKGLADLERTLQFLKTRFIFLIAPSMENFRKQTLPLAIRPKIRMLRLLQLKELSKNLLNFEMLDPMLIFNRFPDPSQFYYSKDFHWNHKGAWLVAREIHSKLTNQYVQWPDTDSLNKYFSPSKISKLYSLQFLALDERLSDHDWTMNVEASEHKAQIKKFKEPVLSLGDSFIESVLEFTPDYFSVSESQMNFGTSFSNRIISERHWHTVVLILSEEKLNRLQISDLKQIVAELK